MLVEIAMAVVMAVVTAFLMLVLMVVLVRMLEQMLEPDPRPRWQPSAMQLGVPEGSLRRLRSPARPALELVIRIVVCPLALYYASENKTTHRSGIVLCIVSQK